VKNSSDLKKTIAARRAKLAALTDGDADLAARLARVRNFAASVRVSEYHVTNGCNIRCKGCWFFEYGFDTKTKDEASIEKLRTFVEREKNERRVNCALLIGGEPTLVPSRVQVFVDHMKYVTVSTNGIRALSAADFPDVAIAVTLFGGGPLDDELRGIKPGGKRFTGLFETSLANYRNDRRASFVYAVTSKGIDHIRPTARRIVDNGNLVSFNYYIEYDVPPEQRASDEARLLDRLLEVKQELGPFVTSHPAYIETLITGRAHGDTFGYSVCPSISNDHPMHADRIANGKPVLPFFNAYSADMETLASCCTSGQCESCHDSQAIYSWLMVSFDRYLDSPDTLRTWVELAESYWSQFVWAPYSPARLQVVDARQAHPSGHAPPPSSRTHAARPIGARSSSRVEVARRRLPMFAGD